MATRAVEQREWRLYQRRMRYWSKKQERLRYEEKRDRALASCQWITSAPTMGWGGQPENSRR